MKNILKYLINIKAYRWFFLFLGMFVDSFGVALVSRANLGISAVSSVAYSLNKAFPVLTFGVWSYIFQFALIVVLSLLTRKVNFQYLFAFVISIVSGHTLDLFNHILRFIPNFGIFRYVWCGIGIFLIAFGVCLMVESDLPITPKDMFIRELVKNKNWYYKRAKTIFDITCLAISCIISIIFCGRILGIGVGTVISALVMGKTISKIRDVLCKYGIIQKSVVK